MVTEGGYTYVLIESRDRHVEKDKQCITRLRSLRLRGGQIYISPHAERVATCPPYQWDTYVFTELFD